MLMSLCSIVAIGADVQSPTPSPALSPPVNHETARIEQVITATDNGFRARQYVVTWRAMRIVVAGTPENARMAGDNLDIVVYRSDVNGHKVLRFETTPSTSNENVADADSEASRASVTLGSAPIEASLSAESDGYQFVGYFVTWHNQRVFVVDPKSAPARGQGEIINFHVVHKGAGANQRLWFSL
jgi:alkylated DNA nucleotide flippase Atl1